MAGLVGVDSGTADSRLAEEETKPEAAGCRLAAGEEGTLAAAG